VSTTKEIAYEQSVKADRYWSQKTSPDYDAFVWYDRNRNKICRHLLRGLTSECRLLSVGGRGWVERELIDPLGCEKVITDIVAGEGIIEADAEDLPFPDGYFDLVISREMIEHVEDDVKLIKELRRVLCPGGHLLITTPNAFAYPIDGGVHVRAYTPDSFLEFLMSTGFEIIKKAGNIPYIFLALIPLSGKGYRRVLEDFKNIDRHYKKDYSQLYYIANQLFVLCRKEG